MDPSDTGKKPVPGPNPAGRDIRTDPLYDDLSSEINKSSSISASSPLDWQKVVNLSKKILEEQSKDLLVCSYLCVGLLKTEGLKGLAGGFHIYRDLLEIYWDTMFPLKTRIRGRLNALSWWVDTLEDSLRGMEGEVWSQRDINHISEDLDAIDIFLANNLDEPPELRSIISMVSSLLFVEDKKNEERANYSDREAPVDIKKQESNTVQTNMPQQQSFISVPDVVTDEDTDRAMRVVFDAMKKILNSMIQQKPLPVLYFRLNRFVAWSTVYSVPPSDDDGKTMLPAPDGQLQNNLKNFYNAGKWQDLLDAAETRVSEFLFWLDLSRYVSESLDHLNQKDLSEEIAFATALYAGRLKGIEKLSFSDGTPFADDITCDWLNNFELKENRKQGVTDIVMPGAFDEQVKEEMEDAEQIAATGDIAGALRGLREKIGSASSGHERFIRVLYFCRFLFRVNQIKLTVPYLQELIVCIDNYKIELWDPKLAINAYKTILYGMKRQKSGNVEDLVDEVTKRLALIDPAGAIKFLG